MEPRQALTHCAVQVVGEIGCGSSTSTRSSRTPGSSTRSGSAAGLEGEVDREALTLLVGAAMRG